jgi:hypothetical protein
MAIRNDEFIRWLREKLRDKETLDEEDVEEIKWRMDNISDWDLSLKSNTIYRVIDNKHIVNLN